MRYYLSFIYLIIYLNAPSQNLIGNGSFENYSGCPGWNDLDSLQNWSSIGTADVYTKCSTPSSIIWPRNVSGFQYPRTGFSYMGFIALMGSPFTTSISKEYFQNELNDTLMSNKFYYLRFYISYFDNFYLIGQNAVAIDSLGFFFSDSLFISNSSGNCNQPPDYYSSNLYNNDTTSWQEIIIPFIALGGEKFVIIGDFKDYFNNMNFLITHYVGPPIQNSFSYYYIDDVAIWPADTIPPPADAGSDTIICRGGKARLGTHSYSDYIYEWWPEATLSNDSGGVVWASPQTTTTYYLQATDDIYTKTLDSVSVIVNNCGQNDTTVCMEQQFQMGSTNNPQWSYQWSPANWLSSDTVGMPLCNPLQNTNYQLLITNQAGDTIALDSTKIIVGACFNASAGKDSLICKNDSLKIGMQNLSFLSYVWSPNFMISDTTIGNPIVWADTNTTYYLKLTDTLGRTTFDSVLVGVHICIGVDEIENNPIKLSVYPNPADDMLVFEFSEMLNTINIRVFDVLGKEVITKEFSHKRKIDIDISSLSSGIYNYEIGKYFKGKFIKK